MVYWFSWGTFRPFTQVPVHTDYFTFSHRYQSRRGGFLWPMEFQSRFWISVSKKFLICAYSILFSRGFVMRDWLFSLLDIHNGIARDKCEMIATHWSNSIEWTILKILAISFWCDEPKSFLLLTRIQRIVFLVWTNIFLRQETFRSGSWKRPFSWL